MGARVERPTRAGDGRPENAPVNVAYRNDSGQTLIDRSDRVFTFEDCKGIKFWIRTGKPHKNGLRSHQHGGTTVSLETQTVGIHGLNCPNCAAKVERGVTSLESVCSADVDFDTEHGVVTYDPDSVSLARIAHVVENTGCDSNQFTLSVDGRRVHPERTAADGGTESVGDHVLDDSEDDADSSSAPF